MPRNPLMTLGMFSLILAGLVHWFVQPAPGTGRDLADGVFGLLTGLSIGFNLASLRCRAS